VHAATAGRAVKQNRGQSRIWLFGGGLFLASLGGIAAAYYLVGPPIATSAYGPGVAGTGKLETSSLLIENNAAIQTSAIFEKGTTAATVPASITVVASDPSRGNPHGPSVVLPPVDIQVTSETVMQEPVAPDLPAQKPVVAAVASSEQQSESDQNFEAAGESAHESSSEPGKGDTVNERMVHIVPTAVSGEVETRTNVNVSKTPTTPRKTIGQWLSVPAEIELATPPTITAAASQQSTEAKPADRPVKTQQELFKSFQAYLESTGNAETIDHAGQKALFNKFIRWSVEAPLGN